MKAGAPQSFGAQLKALRETAGFTQQELATIAGLSAHAVSALERGERRRPHVETVRSLSAALDLTGPALSAFLASARAPAHATVVDELSGVSLPLPPTALLGRDAEMATLRQWLSDTALRLITLIGPGGAGKTRLVLELARAIAEDGATRVVFVALGAIRDPTFVAPAIAEALGLKDISAADLPGRARVACGDQRTLLVLDNFEHVLDATPLVVDLLTSVASLRLLVTSRAPLRVRGEREYAVGPLALEPGSEEMSLADLARVPAVHLFVERVRDVRPDFRLTQANGPTVAAICRQLDALPLALELAAPWMKVLTPEDLLGRLLPDVLLAAPGPRDLPERQQTMNATVAWSYQLLDTEDQRAFRRFGTMPGLFSVDAAAEVLAGRDGASAGSDYALGAVARLVDKSLLLRAGLSVVPTYPLYYMLETVRAYAALELTAAGERDDALEGLVRYCTREASLAAEGLVGPAQVEWLDRVREDLDSYRIVLRWLIQHGRAADASDIASGLLFFWLIRGQVEGMQWYEQISNLPSVSPAAESRALVGAALMQFNQGELGRARAALLRARALSRADGDIDAVGRIDDLSGRIEHARGNLHAARDCFTRAIERFQASDIRWRAGNAQIGMARVALATGDTDQAERLLDEATSNLRQAGPWFLSRALYVRALLAVRRRHADEAIRLVRESLAHLRDLQDMYAFAFGLVPLAAAAVLKGDDVWAARILGARDAMSERTGATVVLELVHELRTHAERLVRTRLGPDRWVRAYAAGRESSIDALIQDIDSERS
jgi:predicted ATPase/DNA-binding XRE family transcriptional regulator